MREPTGERRQGNWTRADLSPPGLLLGVLLAICCFYGNLAKDSYMDDFRAFYVAAQATHDGLDPYRNQVNVSEKYADALWVKADSRFIYPPSALLFAGPLRWLPYKWAKTAFGLAMALAMTGILWGLSLRFPRQHFVLLALFLTLPMFMNIDDGQVDALMLGLLLGAFYLGDGAAAGALLGVAIAVKASPALALLWFLTERRWRTAAWSVLVSGGLLLVAAWRWGLGYDREFLGHLRDHTGDYVGAPMATLAHTFRTISFIGYRVIVTGDGVFSYQHDLGGYLQNPLRLLGRAGGVVGLGLLVGFVGWLRLSGRGRARPAECSFFLFLVLALLANPLLWTMGLVACFPLTVLLVEKAEAPRCAALSLLIPLLLTKQVLGNWNFSVWLVVAGFWVWRNGWLSADEKPAAQASGIT